MNFAGRIQLYPMLRVAVMLAIGIALGDTLCGFMPSWVWMCVLLVALPLLWWWHDRCSVPFLQTAAVFAAVVAGGAWRMACCLDDMKMNFTENEETFSAVVSAAPYAGEASARAMRYELVVADGAFAGHKVYAYLDTSDDVSGVSVGNVLAVGDGVVVTSRLRPVFDSLRVSNGKTSYFRHFDYRRWLMVHDVVARCYVKSGKWRRALIDLSEVSGVKRLGIRMTAFRESLLHKLRDSGMSAEAYSIVSAMAFGDKRALTSDQRETFSVAGASHVLALSGMHLGVVYMLLTMLLARGRRSTYMQSVVLTAVWGYVVMVGMPVSAVRSAVMCTVFSFVSLLGKPNISLNTLGIAAVVLLVASPQCLWDVGFRLSFAAVFGILLFNERMYGFISGRFLMEHRLLKWCWSMFTVSVSAQIMTVPLVLYYFGRFSSYFLLANFVAVPLATLVVYSSVLMCLVLPVPWLNGVAVAAVGGEVALLAKALGFIASLPGASVDNIYIGGCQLILAYCFIALLYALSFYVEKMYRSAYGFRPNKYKKGRKND